MTKIQALKQYLSTPERPITTQEITALKKADPQGFDELGAAALTALATTD